MLIPLLMGLVASFLPSPAPVSCECPDLPNRKHLSERQYDSLLIRQAYRNSEVVFFAKVIGFENSTGSLYQASLADDSWDIPDEKRFGIHPNLELKKTYKGSRKFYKKNAIKISQRWRICDMYFNKGESYMFFGTLDKDGNVRTSICAPNRLIRFEDQLAELEAWLE